jgi:hypothetical protein
MDGRTRRHLEMGARADEFSAAHPDSEAGSALSAAKLTQLVERGRGLAATQREGLIDVAAATVEKRAVRRAMMAGPVAHLAQVGTLAAVDDHELAKAFIFKPSTGSYLAFRTAAGAMAAAAHSNKELLMKHGLSESVLDLLVQLLDKFDAAVRLGTNGRAAHKAATKQLDAVTLEIRRIVRVMDARNRLRFQNDGQLLEEWISRSTVVREPVRVSTSKDGVTSFGDGPTPAAGDDVRPAA